MSNKKIVGIISILFISVSLLAQDLSGVKICLDPGHGGHESDDRYVPETNFWESESNLTKARKLRDILENLGAEVILTRSCNADTCDLDLSERAEIANNNDVDYFNSIHSNAFDGETNYTLTIFNGETDDPTSPQAKEMAEIMDDEIYKVNRTTKKYAWGDLTMHPDWNYGYGVLYNADMPATISEGSFHDYIPESWRLRNKDYRKHEAWGIARAFLEYFNTEDFSQGIIAGIIRDSEYKVTYTSITNPDSYLPVDNIDVTLNPGGRTYSGDSLNNGFYMFDSLQPGDYELVVDAPMYNPDTTSVSVSANQSAFANVYLEANEDFPHPPSTPSWLQIENTGENSLKVKCEPVQNASNYTFRYSKYNDTNFDNTISSEDNQIVLENIEQGIPYYFQVIPNPESHLTQPTKETYLAIPSQNPGNNLVVNGYDSASKNDIIKKWGTPFYKIEQGFSYTLNESVQQGEINLSDYKSVYWILGDESLEDTTLSTAAQNQIRDFLGQGGNLFISGSNIGWDLTGKSKHFSKEDSIFYREYLKATFINNAPKNEEGQYYTAEAVSGGIFDKLGNIGYDDGSEGSFDVNSPDAIKPANGSTQSLKFQEVSTEYGVTGVNYQGSFPNGNNEGKLVYLTFPYETVYSTQQRVDVLTSVTSFFGVTDKIVRDQSSKKFTLAQNAPNPFNSKTTIEYTLPSRGNVELRIYNIKGDLINSYRRESISRGQYRYQWHAKNALGETVPSGVYIYRLKHGGQVKSKKMIYLK